MSKRTQEAPHKVDPVTGILESLTFIILRRIKVMRLDFPKPFLGVFAIVPIIFALSACKEKVAPPVERIRAIKTIAVTERASGRLRKFPGVVEATDSSSLSFEVFGNVHELRVDVGDRVNKGQLIARLDKRQFELSVESAQAGLGRAKAQRTEKRKDFDRLGRIKKLDPGAVSQAAIDQSEAAYKSAQEAVSFTTSKLNLAKRDLKKTDLVAPFDGIISKRYVDEFREVKRGQPIFDVYIQGAMEAVIDIPETSIDDIYIGLRCEIQFPKDPSRIYKGSVSEVSSAAGSASTFPVKVTILDTGGQIRPGMSAQVTLLLSQEDKESGYLIPISALAPGDKKSMAYVFVFDPETSLVNKRPVRTPAGLEDNNVAVKAGLKPGDIIAVAGVSFLEDGQKVKLMER
jgi:RND family efflux transporter MFP subunit